MTICLGALMFPTNTGCSLVFTASTNFATCASVSPTIADRPYPTGYISSICSALERTRRTASGERYRICGNCRRRECSDRQTSQQPAVQTGAVEVRSCGWRLLPSEWPVEPRRRICRPSGVSSVSTSRSRTALTSDKALSSTAGWRTRSWSISGLLRTLAGKEYSRLHAASSMTEIAHGSAAN